VNVLIHDFLIDIEGRGFGFFEYALAGVPLLAGAIAIVVLFGERLLPTRDGRNLPPDLSRHASTLVEQYRLAEGMHTLRVHAGSPLVDTPRAALDLGDRPGVGLVTVKEPDASGTLRRETIAAGDIVVVRGAAEAVAMLATDLDLGIVAAEVEAGRVADTLFNRDSGLAEVLIPPRSPLIGERFFPGMVTRTGDMIVLAIQRQGGDLPAGEPLAAGDTLLLQGTWNALDSRLDPARALVVNAPDMVRRQAVPLGRGAWPMLGIMAALVVVLALNVMPAAAAGLIAACAIVVTGLLTVDQMYRSINWTTVILVGAMMPLSTAITQTGAAQLLAEGLVAVLGDLGPRAVLAGLFVLTAILGQVISNTATAFIIIPISVVTAQQMDVSAAPFLMGVCIAAAGAFLTPVATPTNLMVQEPADYRFGDYWKLGLPMMIWFFIVSLFLVPLIWPF
jgi:di/tricarboxylate transporter